MNNHTNLVVFGISGAVGSDVTVYPLPGNGSASGTELKIPVARNCTAKNLYVKMATAPGGSVTDTITVRKNGADQSLTCSVSASNTTGNDTSNTFSVNAGDELSVKYVSGSGSAAANVVVSFEVEFPQ